MSATTNMMSLFCLGLVIFRVESVRSTKSGHMFTIPVSRGPPTLAYEESPRYHSDYRLGNVFYTPENPRKYYAIADWSGSVAERYVILTEECASKTHTTYEECATDMKLALGRLTSILTENPRRFDKPPKQAVVMHLRLGDMLGEQDTLKTADELFQSGSNSVMGKHDFEEIEQKLREAANTLTFDPRTIVLMASTEHCGDGSSWFDVEKQKEYLNIIKVFFSDLGYHVSLRLNELADADIYFASQASIFVPSHGSYSQLIRQCVDYLGGLNIVSSRLPENVRSMQEADKPCSAR